MSQETQSAQTGMSADEFDSKRRGATVLVIVGLAICLGIGSLFGYSLAQSDVEDARAEALVARQDLEHIANVFMTIQERNWALYLEVIELRAENQATREALPEGVYADGVYLVGDDIAPGTYRGEVLGEFGYWARLRNTTGMVNGIISNAVVRGPFVVTVVDDDEAIELRGVRITAAE